MDMISDTFSSDVLLLHKHYELIVKGMVRCYFSDLVI